MPVPLETTRDVLDRCRAAGFAAAGVAPAVPSQWGAHLRDWLATGRHGTMDYLAADMGLRLAPGAVWESTRGFIVVADQYARRGDTPADDRPRRGRIARYAQGRDYHDVMKRRLHALADGLRLAYPGSGFRTCVDTVPILERELAQLAGIGWQARNTMIIDPRLGSYFLLGVVATSMELEPPAEQGQVPDCCGTCTRCVDACPTQAITPYSVDASRCISYLTIERREPIDPALHAAIGGWVFGCDICQEVCPHNSPRTDGSDVGTPHEAYASRGGSFDLLEVLGWTAETRREAVRTSSMKRAALPLMKRNALIAAGNDLRRRADPELLARVREIAADAGESDLVTRTARDVLAAIARGPAWSPLSPAAPPPPTAATTRDAAP